jgi:FkbM family methyltransferase
VFRFRYGVGMYNPDWLRYCKRVVRAGLGTDHLLEPELRIATRRLGSDYGGWVVAVEPLHKTAHPIVLSFGLGDDISFDEEISRRYGARVYGFDPTTVSLNWIAARGRPPNMRVFPIGISDFDGRQKFTLPGKDKRGNFSTKATAGHPIICDVMRYGSILTLLELQHIDVLKLDIEGSEYDVIPDIVASSVLPVQLLIEFHHRLHDIRVAETRKAVSIIREAGFSLFSVSPAGQELSFIRCNVLDDLVSGALPAVPGLSNRPASPRTRQ